MPLHVQVLSMHALFVSACLFFLTGNRITFTGPGKPLVEICDNGIDDDHDGLIDLNDPDCICDVVEAVSLIPNPSFEEMNCCPKHQSQMDCATGWIQASEATTDFIHTCDWLGWDEFPPPRPFPDGEGIMGFRDGRVGFETAEPEYNWKEYAGACLLSPLVAHVPYIFEFYVGFVDRFRSPTINITFFGTTDCSNLPFGVGNDAFGCPTNGPGWINLGSTLVSGGGGHKWVKATIEVVPDSDIAAIAIGPDCPPVPSPISIYYFFDNLTLVDLATYQFKISELAHPCSPDFTMQVPDQPGFSYQWYKNGVALVGEISAVLSMSYGEGDYQVRVMKDGSCLLTQVYSYQKPVIENHVITSICEGESILFGNQSLTSPGSFSHTFVSVDGCDSIVLLDLSVIGHTADTVTGRLFRGETFTIPPYAFDHDGTFELHFTSSLGCDSVVQLILEYYDIFIPNVFSPNQDGINDLFTASAKNDQLLECNMAIYDRWGNQLFRGSSWDGTSGSRLVNPGVYSYLATLRMDDGRDRKFTGTITVLR